MYHIMHEKQGFAKTDVDKLSILFQALGFICRLLVQSHVATSTPSANVNENLNKMINSEDKTQELHITYLVPCQLPDERPDVDKLHERWSMNEEFFFNFPGFLPPVLFQHLLVRLVAHMQQQTDLVHSLESGEIPLLSKKACFVAKDSSVRFTMKMMANRIVVRHQLSDHSAGNLLMEWLFQMVADISKQKFTNLTFACGRLCPYTSCLKQCVKKECKLDAKCEFHIFDVPKFNELRSTGLPVVKCLYELRLLALQQTHDKNMTSLISPIEDLLLIARNKGHIETMFSYSCGYSNHHAIVPCVHSDTSEVASQLPVNLEGLSMQHSMQSPQEAVSLSSLMELRPAVSSHDGSAFSQLEQQIPNKGVIKGTISV
jgi:hypothetical protein